MRKAPERGRRAWSLSHVPWSLILRSSPFFERARYTKPSDEEVEEDEERLFD